MGYFSFSVCLNIANHNEIIISLKVFTSPHQMGKREGNYTQCYHSNNHTQRVKGYMADQFKDFPYHLKISTYRDNVFLLQKMTSMFLLICILCDSSETFNSHSPPYDSCTLNYSLYIILKHEKFFK